MYKEAIVCRLNIIPRTMLQLKLSIYINIFWIVIKNLIFFIIKENQVWIFDSEQRDECSRWIKYDS